MSETYDARPLSAPNNGCAYRMRSKGRPNYYAHNQQMSHAERLKIEINNFFGGAGNESVQVNDEFLEHDVAVANLKGIKRSQVVAHKMKTPIIYDKIH